MFFINKKMLNIVYIKLLRLQSELRNMEQPPLPPSEEKPLSFFEKGKQILKENPKEVLAIFFLILGLLLTLLVLEVFCRNFFGDWFFSAS